MVRSAPYDSRASVRSRTPGFAWSDALLTAAATVGLYVSIWNYFDRLSGISNEPGTLLVIIACGLILIGLAVTVSTSSRGLRRTFQWLILLGTVLTALAGWFLMSWTLTGAMVVAAIAQILRMGAPDGRDSRLAAQPA